MNSNCVYGRVSTGRNARMFTWVIPGNLELQSFRLLRISRLRKWFGQRVHDIVGIKSRLNTKYMNTA